MGHGRGYRYPHDYPEAVSGQDYLERPIRLYSPKSAGAEKAIGERLERWRKLRDSMPIGPGKGLAD
jgi:putative ATPase